VREGTEEEADAEAEEAGPARARTRWVTERTASAQAMALRRWKLWRTGPPISVRNQTDEMTRRRWQLWRAGPPSLTAPAVALSSRRRSELWRGKLAGQVGAAGWHGKMAGRAGSDAACATDSSGSSGQT
jgi:hypothetical protein